MKTLATLVFALVALSSSSAAAEDPATLNSIQIGLGFRYGIDLEDAPIDPWGSGIGLSGGITLPMAVYVGGVAEYFFGEEVSTVLGDVSANVWQIMGEAGYDLGLGSIVVIRPKLGLGLAGLSVGDDSEAKFAFAPGVTTMFFLGVITLTGDFRYDIVLADPDNATALIFSVGIGF